MSVRNCREVGGNLQKIVTRLMANDKLVNLIYYSDKDPLSKPFLTNEQKKQEIFEKLIKIIPRIGPKEDAKSLITISVIRGSKLSNNNEFRNIVIKIEIFVPMTQWIIKDSNLRPFAILGEIQDCLDGKTVNGLGKMISGGFDINFLTDEMSCYEMSFSIVTYD